MTTLLQQMQDSNIRYSNKFVSNIIKIQRAKTGDVSPNTKKMIFFMVKKIVLRGISNYQNINKSRGNCPPYEPDDMLTELYLVLNECIVNFDTEKNKSFYLYFNKAVAHRISRMANYKSHQTSHIISYDKELNDEGFTLKDVIADKTGQSHENLYNMRCDLSSHGINEDDLEDIFHFGKKGVSKKVKNLIKKNYEHK